MALLTKHNEFWLEHNNKQVIVDGLKYKIKVSSHTAIYPYKHEVIHVNAEIINKSSKQYLEMKQQLQDDWVLDILASSVETEIKFQEEVLK